MMLRSVLGGLFFTVPVTVTFFDVVGYIAKVDGLSMQPTFNPGHKKSQDKVWLNKWCVRKHQYCRGEIISLVSPQDPDELLIKRIIAMPGDDVETLGYKNRYVSIPQGHLWVEGDNHGNSKDSNQFGPVAMGLVHSKAHYILWPPSRWQYLQEQVPHRRLNNRGRLEPDHLKQVPEDMLKKDHLCHEDTTVCDVNPSHSS